MWVFTGPIWSAAKKGSLRVQGLCISPSFFLFFLFLLRGCRYKVLIVQVCTEYEVLFQVCSIRACIRDTTATIWRRHSRKEVHSIHIPYIYVHNTPYI